MKKPIRVYLLLTGAITIAVVGLLLARSHKAERCPWDPTGWEVAIRWVYSSRVSHSPVGCINALRRFDGAKQMWALENGKSKDDEPTVAELTPYLVKEMVEYGDIRLWPARGQGLVLTPVEFTNYLQTNGPLAFCPAGGVFKAGKVTEPVTCSLDEKCRLQHHTLTPYYSR